MTPREALLEGACQVLRNKGYTVTVEQAMADRFYRAMLLSVFREKAEIAAVPEPFGPALEALMQEITELGYSGDDGTFKWIVGGDPEITSDD